ncbi:unnamed protein product [Calypogeia fissa]
MEIGTSTQRTALKSWCQHAGMILTVVLLNLSNVRSLSESEALLDFKAGIREDPGASLENWVPGTEHCDWYGVTCDTDTKSVIKLQLRTGLSGTLDPALPVFSSWWKLTWKETVSSVNFLKHGAHFQIWSISSSEAILFLVEYRKPSAR